jgi:small subunit ribosomal protein S2
LLELKKLEEDGQMELLPKNEAKGLRRQIQKLEYLLNGIVNMRRYPEAVFIIDAKKEYIAIREARKLGIPIVAVIDTNCDPSNADFIIPSNDDAIRAIKLFTARIADACIEGKHIYEQRVLSGEIAKPVVEEAPIVVERKVFVFKEYGEDVRGMESTSVAISEGSPKANEIEEDSDNG